MTKELERFIKEKLPKAGDKIMEIDPNNKKVTYTFDKEIPYDIMDENLIIGNTVDRVNSYERTKNGIIFLDIFIIHGCSEYLCKTIDILQVVQEMRNYKIDKLLE